jgi:hypothetical protein
MRSALLDPSVFGFDYDKACGDPVYGVRIQFHRDSDQVDVLLCFKCVFLGVYRSGKAIGGEDVDDARPQLVSIVKELFPDDEVIQSLR